MIGTLHCGGRVENEGTLGWFTAVLLFYKHGGQGYKPFSMGPPGLNGEVFNRLCALVQLPVRIFA